MGRNVGPINVSKTCILKVVSLLFLALSILKSTSLFPQFNTYPVNGRAGIEQTMGGMQGRGEMQMQARQTRRTNTLNTTCAKIKHKLQPKQCRPLSCMYADDVKKIVYCLPPKAGCTVLKRAIGTISGNFNFTTLMNMFPDKYRRRLSQQMKFNPSEFVHTRQWEQMVGLKHVSYPLTGRTDYLKAIVVRNPFERFVSAYKDRIVSLQTPNGKVHGLAALDKSIRTTMRGATSHIKNISSFSEALRYHAKISGEHSKEIDRHFLTLYSACSPCDIHYDYVIKQETLYEDISNFYHNVLKSNISMEGLLDRSQGPTSKTKKYEKTLQEYYSEVKEDAKQAARIYLGPDAQMFGYDYPFLT